MPSRFEDKLAGGLFVRGEIVGIYANKCPTSARHGDGLEYIRIWATSPRRLIFWDSAPSSYKWYQSHAPNLVVCVGDVRPPRVQQKAQ